MAEDQVVREQVVDIIRPYFRIRVDEHTIASTTRIDELGIDSARIVDIALDLENRFNIQIPDDQFDKFDTIGNIASLVHAHTS